MLKVKSILISLSHLFVFLPKGMKNSFVVSIHGINISKFMSGDVNQEKNIKKRTNLDFEQKLQMSIGI